MRYEPNKIYRDTIYDKPGYVVVGKTEQGNLIHIDSGTWKDRQYTNIKIYEVFKTEKGSKEFKLARKKLAGYDKKLRTTFYMVRIQPELLPQVAEILIKLYNEIYGKKYKLETKGVIEKVQKEQDEMSELLKKTGVV